MGRETRRLTMFESLNGWLENLPGGGGLAIMLGARILLLLILGFLANWITKRILLRVIKRVVKQTQTNWDDILLERHVFERLSHLAPGLVLYLLGPEAFGQWPTLALFVQKAAVVYMLAVALSTMNAFLDAVVEIYRSTEASRNKPIKGYTQVVKILFTLAFIIVMFSVLLDRSPLVMLSGLGAMTAIILLVFKDSILGFVAGIQLASNDMLRPGDWIEMPRYGADGNVIDIALTTVKVRNWDKTITTIPSYSLIADSFKNWRGMEECGGRRIKRALNIDMNSIAFLSAEQLERLGRFSLLRDYLAGKKSELAESNQGAGDPVNSRRLTNVGTFRAYMAAYLRSLPVVHEELTFLVRQLDPGEHGLPIEIYFFSTDQEWANYEAIQSDIFDHLLALLPEFGLRIFQSPGGADFQAAFEARG
jgi:miniconductance mechanosensitive channel